MELFQFHMNSLRQLEEVKHGSDIDPLSPMVLRTTHAGPVVVFSEVKLAIYNFRLAISHFDVLTSGATLELHS